MNNLISKPKQVLLGLYKKEIWDSYQFSIIELFIFDRFFNWALSEQMDFIEIGKTRFFLIDYKSLAPCWGMSVIYLKKIMLHLSGSLEKGESTNLRFPLINHFQQDERKIWRSYFTFEKNVMNVIISWDTLTPKRKVYLEGFVNNNGLFSKQDLVKLLPQVDKKDVICSLSPNVEKILIELDKLKLPDNRRLFSFTLPTDHKIHTKSMKHFQDALYDLYEGRFNTRYQLSNFFKEKNNYYLDKHTADEIKLCKGNWEQISMVVQCAAKNFISWFDLNRESTDKGWLKQYRDIGTWIYYDEKSMFMVSIKCKATKTREVIAENMYNRLPESISNKFLNLYNDEWDNLAYWNRIYSVYKWYKENAKELMNENNNYRYWLDSGVEKFMQGYYDFINTVLGKKYLKSFGTKCKTWNWFIESKKEEHGIEE